MASLDDIAALVVIDLQKGLAATPTAHPFADVVRRAARLADAFRARSLPVVVVTATGGAPGRTDAPARSGGAWPADFAEPVDELGSHDADVRISKRTWGAFHGTGLDAALRERGVTQIVLTGVATSAGVESTARAAHEHGYNVLLVTDAMTDSSSTAHEHSVERTFPRLGERAVTDEVLALL